MFNFYIETINLERQFISFWPVLSYAARLSTPPSPVYLFYVVSDTIMSIGKSLGSVNASPVYTLTCCSDDENCVYRKHYWITVPSKTLHISWKKTSKTRIVSGCSFFFSLFHRKVAGISNDMAFSSAFKRKQKVNKQTSKLKKYITHFAP